MSKSSELDKFMKAYIIESIDLSGYDLDHLEGNDRIKAVNDVFISEYNWNIAKIGRHNAMIEWLQGLPSCLNLPVYYNDILKLAIKTGYYDVKNVDDFTDKQADTITGNWYNLISTKLNQLINKVV